MSDEQLDEVREILRDIPREAIPPERVWDGVRARIDRERHGGRWLQLAAAAMLIFSAGVLVGRIWSQPPSKRTAATASASEIQRSGTEYVIALATFRNSTMKDARAIRQAREAALSTLYGASTEVIGLAPGDARVVTIRHAAALAAGDPEVR